MRLRQIVTVARDLRPVERQLIDAFDLEVCYRDPGLAHFGLRHGLYAIGDRLLEVVAPAQPGTTAERFLDRRGGDGGYMVIVQVDDDLDVHRDRMRDLGVRVVHEATVPGIEGLHLHPGDVGAAIVSIDKADPPEAWPWAGRDWEYHSASRVVDDIVGITIEAAEPERMAARWASVLDRTVSADGTIELDDAVVRFVPVGDRGDGFAGFDLRAIDRSRVGETFAIGGVEIGLV